MTKTDFLEILRRNISQVNDYNYVNECIDYYDTYINTQINKGKTEDVVLEELGDPKLIAKSIVASRLQVEPEDAGTERNADEENYRCIVINGKDVMVPKWALKILTVVVIILLLLLVGTVAKFVFPFVFVYFLIRMIVRNIFKK